MGLITRVMGLLFGGDDVIARTAHVFRENAEAAARRAHVGRTDALGQFAAEFARPRRGLFDRVIDGVNRLPRPAMALGTLGLLGSAMVAPIWFASRMQGVALVPEPLWWLLGAIVSFYFGARHQVKGQEFRRSVAETMARAGAVAGNIRALDALEAEAAAETATGTGPEAPAAPPRPAAPRSAPSAGGERSNNPALDEWRAGRG